MNFSKFASEPQLNDPAAPPVEMMYFLPAATHFETLAATRLAGVTPAQFSEPHSPVANAQVSDLCLAGITLSTGDNTPVFLVDSSLVFQFRLIVMSLYEPKTSAVGGGASHSVVLLQ